MAALQQGLVAVLHRTGGQIDPQLPEQQLKAPDKHLLTRHRARLQLLPAADIDLAVPAQQAFAAGDTELLKALTD